jgi:IrrE N-terminal-like domain
LEPDDFKCRWIEKEELWKITKNFRQTYWPEKDLPVNTEMIVEFRLRLDIDPKHGLFSANDMDAYLRSDLSGIVVDHDFYMNEKYANRMRFSFAHELGHFVLHQEIISAIRFESVEEWKRFILGVPERDYGYFEWQANEFAGRLLVPRDELKKEIEKAHKVVRESSDLIRYLEREPEAVLSRVSPMLCKPFGVSTDVIETRARREGVWPPT